MRSDFGRQRNAYPSRNRKGKHSPHDKKHAGASLTFCWVFGFVVCAVFGLASFLMFSAGHFDFGSSGSGVNAAWGGMENSEENFVTGSLIKVEVTDIDGAKNTNNQELYAQARNVDVSKLEEFGPFPKYLSDYESIILTVNEDGTKLPENEEEEDEKEIAAAMKLEIAESLESANDVHEEVLAAEKTLKSEATATELIATATTEKIAPLTPIFAENAVAWREHVVKNGETLSDIAASHGLTTQDILKANGLKNANVLSENQLLLIPNDSSKIDETFDEVRTRQMRVAAVKEKIEPIKTKSYMIAKGDSLWSIANSQNIEVDTLIGSNNSKTSSRLRPGATLRIPNQDGIFYTMKKGDTIEAVAKRYGVGMNKLRQVNTNVNTASLKTGDEIFLPGAKPNGLMGQKDSDVKVAEIKKNEKTSKSSTKTTAKNEKATKLPKGEVAVANTGAFRWPIMGRINSPFGWRYHPITKRRDFHTGIDIKANRNDPIKAAAPGKVAYSGWMGGYGKVIVVEHLNGQSSLYAHCSSLLVGKGENVSSGKLIAKIGTTGRSTGPHLHFEIRNGNSPVNPIKYLSR